MRCIKCKSTQTSVSDTRIIDDFSIKRRRFCESCGNRFTTLEKPYIKDIYVIKKDGSKSLFDKEKIKKGIIRAFNKLDFNQENILKLVDSIETEITEKYKSEIKSSDIGNIILEKLSLINDVAYIRFASVYNKFDSIESFLETINKMKLNKGEK